MKLVIDANIVIAVVLGEPEKNWALDVTRGGEAIGPRSLPFEIGNALSRLVKRRRLRSENIDSAWAEAAKFDVALIDIDMQAALRLAANHDLYAYDGYMLQCALETRATLVTLDQPLSGVARKIGLQVMER